MARYDHLPIWKTTMDLAVLLERVVRGFPRYHKYALGADLRRQSQRICTLIVRANEARAERERVVALAPICLDRIAGEPAPTKGDNPPRPGFAACVEIPAKSLPRLRRKLKAAGIPHIALAETGYLESGHKRRERVYSWAPPGAFPSFHPIVR